MRQLKAHFHSGPQASILASLSHRQSSGLSSVIPEAEPRSQADTPCAVSAPKEAPLQA